MAEERRQLPHTAGLQQSSARNHEVLEIRNVLIPELVNVVIGVMRAEAVEDAPHSLPNARA
eukprot:1848665-Lingulodinium_polyedra.AAC.1